MTPDRARLLAVHQSDSDCLRRFHAERVEGIDAPNEAAKIGTAAHRACEAVAYFVDETGEEEPDRERQLGVALTAVSSAAVDLGMTQAAADEARRIMTEALGPRSRLKFGRPDGWTVGVEVRFGLDKDFRACDPDHPKRLAGGTIDRLDWKEDEGRVIVTDYKTTLTHQGHDDILGGWQPWVYSLWALANYDVRSVTFRFVNLRHGYSVQEELHASGAWVESAKSRIRSLRQARETAVDLDLWPETLGDSCPWCPVRHQCGEMAKAAKDGRVIDPTLTPAQIAGRRIALSVLAADYDDAARAIVRATQKPIALPHGMALGLKPTSGWRLIPKYADPETGHVTAAQREALLAELRFFHMTPAQEFEWFGFVREGDLAGAVKTALHELLGRSAKDFIDRGFFIEPVTDFTFSPWIPETGKRAAAKDIDTLLDELGW